MNMGVDRTVEHYAPFPPFDAWLIEPFDPSVAEGFEQLLEHASDDASSDALAAAVKSRAARRPWTAEQSRGSTRLTEASRRRLPSRLQGGRSHSGPRGSKPGTSSRTASTPMSSCSMRARLHHYAPVAEAQPEMARLIREIRSGSFTEAHPVMQAAFAHYAFVCIHPFPDGNGRVARALASVFLYRSPGVPLLTRT